MVKLSREGWYAFSITLGGRKVVQGAAASETEARRLVSEEWRDIGGLAQVFDPTGNLTWEPVSQSGPREARYSGKEDTTNVLYR
jgi:hypothetical protein